MALEEAICAARASVYQDGDSIVIEKGKKRRERENDVKDMNKRSGDPDFWKRKYHEVKKLRDEAEDDLENQIRHSREREAALEKYSSLLVQKIDMIQAARLEKNADETKNVNISDAQSKVLKFYELMTSMSVKEENGGMVCTLKNRIKRKATRFMIRNIDGENLDYIPRGNIDFLPEYLQSEITFEKDMSPILLADALQALFDDDEEQSERDSSKR
jgi:hypothetical protein